MIGKINLKNISVVLTRPRYPENIGAAARAIKNMGIAHLIVVKPENYETKRILKMATHFAADIVGNVVIFDNLEEALSPFNYVIGTTARLGGQRQVIKAPSKMAKELISISQENQIAILFGPEDKGLSNEDIRYCHALVNIETSEFSSLNLAQAVMIICYEIFIANKDECNEEFIPRLAMRHELDEMYEQLKEIMVRICFINTENPDYWMNNIRQFFSRIGLRAKEVAVIRGICRQINWYGKKCYQDGFEGREKDNEIN